MAQFHVADQARTDLDKIWDYLYGEAGEAVADTETDRFYEGFQTLAEFPFMGPDRPEVAPNVRSFPVGSYIVFYRPTDYGVEISRVRHGGRDPDSMLNI